MKKIILILNTLIMFELIALPAVPGFSSLLLNSAHAASPAECESQGLVYNAATNDCNISNTAAKALNNVANCEDSPNREECYRQHAMDQMTKDSENGSTPKARYNSSPVNGEKLLTGVATAGALAIAIAGIRDSKGNTCSAISYGLMIAGAASLVAGDLIANITHDSKMKKIRGKWGEILNGEKEAKGDKDKLKIAGIDAQSAAFGLLAESEDAMAKTAKTKSLLFKIAGVAFAGSAIAAGLEKIAEKSTGGKIKTTCEKPKKNNGVGNNNTENTTETKVTTNCAGFTGHQLMGCLAQKPIQDAVNNKAKKDANKAFKGAGSSNAYHGTGRYFEKIDLSNLQTNLDIKVHNISSSEDIASLYINYEAQNRKYQSPSIDEYEEIKEVYSSLELEKDQFELLKEVMVTLASNINPLPTAHAKKEETNSQIVYDHYEDKQVLASTFTIGGAALVGAIGGGLASKGNWMTTPVTRMAFSGVVSGLSFALGGEAKKQADAAEDRAAHLRAIEQSMLNAKDGMSICKSEDRNNPAKPHCYCYTPDNVINPARSGSEICQGLYGGNTEILPGEYNKLPGTNSTCVNNSYATDPNCTCKKTNSCMKLNLAGLNLLNPGAFKVSGAAFGPVQDIATGSYDPAKISSAKLDQNAARLDALQKQIEKHPALKAYAKEKNRMQQGMTNSLMKAASSLPNQMADSGMRSLPSNPAEAIKQLEDELAKPSVSSEGSSEGGAVAAQAASPEFGLSFDDLADQESQVAEVMNKDFEYGTNDINTGSSTNIFEVLSNRYQRSGMRRLFDEKGLTKPESPAKSDITQ